MLEPRSRRLLLDALRPPKGFRLTDALGVTYTLDLLALLTTPLSFAMFDWEDREGRPVAEPVAILEAIRRHAEHLHVFCQAGMIHVPKADQRLLALLEPCVVEVRPPPGGIFHPKAWVLRFEAPSEPVLYRVLVSTRNLTFDRSWDTLLQLEGEVRDRTTSIAASKPLAEFLRALPGMALHQPTASRVTDQVERMAEELGRTKFEAPAPFEELWFEPLGTPPGRGKPLSIAEAWKTLIVSPFLSAGPLETFAAPSKEDTLVSTAASLDAVPHSLLKKFGRVFALADGAEGEASAEEDDDVASTLALRGLHAKLYVAEQGWDAIVYTGSANATGSLLGTSVELMVALKGKKSRCGVDTFVPGLKTSDPQKLDAAEGFLSLLQPYPLRDDWQPVADPQRALDDELDRARTEVAAWGLRASVTSKTPAGPFALALVATGPPPKTEGLEVRCWPALLPSTAQKPLLPSGGLPTFTDASFEALTTFWAFEARLQRNGLAARAEFVLNLPTEGMPADRRDRILRAVLADKRTVLRLLLLLLADEGADVRHLLEPEQTERGEAAGSATSPWIEADLFESLVRALRTHPQRIADVRALIEDLRRTPESAALLPTHIDEVMAPILEVWQQVKP